MHEVIGQIGHHGAIAAFIFAIISFVYYSLSFKKNSLEHLLIGRFTFLIHALSVMTVIVSLFFIIYNHYYEYHYAWAHSSNDLPVHYMISCFWEGQEGSFILWSFWNVVLMFILLFKKDPWEAPVMAVLMLIQVVMSSMILGFSTFWDIKLGSSPFIYLRDVFYDAQLFINDPNHVPLDGTGLNALLQNYWMVIHPPTLFLGFALTHIPFAYAIAGLLKNNHTDWIKKAFSWTLVAASILGIGIMMGAFWAYETLNFGGYWNWDPVENAVFVPWLVIVALIHSKTLNEKKGTALGLSYVLAIAAFVLILYSTFLTRSGILGNSSVHSFTDLGLSGQLLIFLLLFTLGSIAILILKWKTIPKSKQEVTVYTRDFWIFAGILVFAFSAFQILLATSFPVFNAIGNSLGFNTNLAPPSDQVQFYSKFQVWAGVLILFFGAIGQYVWWNKIDPKKIFNKVILAAALLLLFIAIGYITIFSLDKSYGIVHKVLFKNDTSETTTYIIRVLSYILLFAMSLFALVVASISLYKIKKSFAKLSGGAISHIGVALMMLGFLFSSGYSKVISTNSGIISKEFTAEQNQENIVLWRHTPLQMGNYSLTYIGQFYEPRGGGKYINVQDVQPLDSIGFGVAKADLEEYKLGDTISFPEENVYYKVDYKSETEAFSIYPRVQRNESMGGILPSPDLRRYLTSDIYSYIASVPTQGDEWSDTTYKKIGRGDTIIVNDYVGFIDSVAEVTHVSGIEIANKFPEGRAFTVFITFLGKNGESYQMTPSMLIDRQGFRSFVNVSDDIATSLVISDWPKTRDDDDFELGINTSAVDYVILHAERKPLINLVWAGTLLTALGFAIAAFRRKRELKPSTIQ